MNLELRPRFEEWFKTNIGDTGQFFADTKQYHDDEAQLFWECVQFVAATTKEGSK